MWIDILRREVTTKGPKQVAAELGVSRSSVDLLCSGKYRGSTKKMEQRIKTIYGKEGKIACPVLGTIDPLRCAETWKRAQMIGMKAGNPDTLKLYKACQSCAVRNR
ncbi:MAG TPA: hypothetical protein PLX02_14695 [Syntrophorhabdaceae bacterium]|nr:hypothetical protein [Syntrophorhabdaceae bacterium]